MNAAIQPPNNDKSWLTNIGLGMIVIGSYISYVASSWLPVIAMGLALVFTVNYVNKLDKLQERKNDESS